MHIGPIIAGVRGYKEMEAAMKSSLQTIFLLGGELIGLRDMCRAIRAADKEVYLHLDLVKGLSKEESAIHFLSREVKPTGIISTHRGVIQAAKKYKMLTVQRFFLIDSASSDGIVKTCQATRPDFIEVMPGVAHKHLQKLTQMVNVPVIAGGLLDDEEDVQAALDAGCVAVSTSKRELWGRGN